MDEVDCIGTGADVECVVSSESDELLKPRNSFEIQGGGEEAYGGGVVWEWVVLISPFFFWGYGYGGYERGFA